MRSGVGLALPSISDVEIREIQELAHSTCGLDLPESKRELVASRLEKKMRALKLHSFHAYYSHVVEDKSGEGLVDFIDALTTNHTGFLREAGHFQTLHDFLAPAVRRGRPFRIWSAACSTGEEPYSIAMTLLEDEQLPPDSWSILATDISSRVLAAAEKAAYPAHRIPGIPDRWLHRFFEQGQGEWKSWARGRKEISGRVR